MDETRLEDTWQTAVYGLGDQVTIPRADLVALIAEVRRLKDENTSLKAQFAGYEPDPVLEVLKRLANEAESFLSQASPADHGFTNIKILRARIAEARSLTQ